MEDVLDFYTCPCDSYFPQVCMDETSDQMLKEPRLSIPTTPGRAARVDFGYEWVGVATVFLAAVSASSLTDMHCMQVRMFTYVPAQNVNARPRTC
jgi:hypothetical protein